MATHIRTNGSSAEVDLVNGTLAEMQKAVGGYIEFLRFRDGSAIMANEEGLLVGLPFNATATALARAKGADAYLVGDVVFFSAAEMTAMEGEE